MLTRTRGVMRDSRSTPHQAHSDQADQEDHGDHGTLNLS
jgi:hypothetical protein